MMKKFLFIAVVFALAGCAEGRRYQGRPASYWHEELKHSDLARRRHAAHALGAIGPAAAAAVPDLTKALNDDDMLMRFESAAALGRIGPAAKAAVPALEAALKDENEAVREAAKYALKDVTAEPEPGR